MEGFSSRGELETRLRWVGENCVYVSEKEQWRAANRRARTATGSVDDVQSLEVEESARGRQVAGSGEPGPVGAHVGGDVERRAPK